MDIEQVAIKYEFNMGCGSTLDIYIEYKDIT